MKKLFELIKKSRYKKLVVILLLLFILAINWLVPWYILKGYGHIGTTLLFLKGITLIGTLFAYICILFLLYTNSKFGCFLLILTILSQFFFYNTSHYVINKILWSKTIHEVTEIKAKRIETWATRTGETYSYGLYVNSRTTNNHVAYVNKEIFDSVNKGDTILIYISILNNNMWNVENIHPTTEEVEELYIRQKLMSIGIPPIISYNEYKQINIDSLLVNSHCQLGTIYIKEDDEHFRHIVKVGVDSLHTTTHEFIGKYETIYDCLNVGDQVLLQVSDSLHMINRVISWRPTAQELELYQQPQPFSESMMVKDYSNCSEEFEKQMLHESHKRLGIIYDKYKDNHVGAYLEVGIDERYTRVKILHTYNEKEMSIYNRLSVGDTIILRVSDSIPQLNKVLKWHPTHEEIEKYRTPVKLIEK